MSWEGWRYFYAKVENEKLQKELKWLQEHQDYLVKEYILPKEEEKIEAGDWVKVVDEDAPGLNNGEIYRVSSSTAQYVSLCDKECGWSPNRFELIRKHDAPFKVGDKIKSRILGTEFELNHATSVFSLNEYYKKYYYLVEPVESIQYKKEKEEMSRDNDIAKAEYKLRYKQVKDFSAKDLEEAGACETALLKILKDKQCLYEIPFRYGYWSDDREQYFDQNFNGVNGLTWLEKHGFIQKLEPEYIYAKDLKYGEYAVIATGNYKDTLVCKPYDTDKLISVVDPLLTWSDPSCKVKSVDKNKVEVSYRFKD